MNVLITGGTGFIGQELIPSLLKAFPDINILTLNRVKENAVDMFLAYYDKRISHTFSNDWESVLSFSPDVVFHLAAFNTSSNQTDLIEPLISSNITYGTMLLDTLSHCHSLKLFVYCGSFAEYRLGPSVFSSAYLYAATKTAFRSIIDYYSDLSQFKYISFVLYSVYGGKPTVKRLIDYMIESIGSPIPVDLTAGEQILDFIHISDVISVFKQVISEFEKYLQLPNGEDFHIGTGHGTSIRDVATIIEGLTHKKCNINWGGRQYRKREPMFAVAPISKNIEVLGWKSNLSVTDGLNIYLNKFYE